MRKHEFENKVCIHCNLRTSMNDYELGRLEEHLAECPNGSYTKLWEQALGIYNCLKRRPKEHAVNTGRD